jgi:streptogramin lyase
MGIRNFSRAARHTTCALALSVGLLAAAATAASAAVDCQATPGFCRAESFFPTDAGNVSALANLGSTGAPDDDLLTALDDLGAAQAADDAAGVAKARGRARAILEGSTAPLVANPDPSLDDSQFLDAKAYKGIALLNTAAKVQDVPSGTTHVDIREVRYGDHAILDTSMLRFEDMGTPFTATWHITELGTSFGGELSPAAVPAGGQGRNLLVQPLALGPMATGTHAVTQRFHPDGGPEATRLATQTIDVDMPAPSELGGGILDPNLKPGHETFAQIAVGPSSASPPAMPAAADVAAASPERQIDDAMRGTAAVDVAQMQDLVAAMRSRDTLPIPSLAGTADAGVAFANAEAYTNTRELRLAADTSPDGTMTLALTNLDGIARDVAIRELRDRSSVAALGAVSWGAFTTDVLATVHLPAGMTTPQTVTVKPAAGAFSLWIGDPDGGDQAGSAIALDRGPRRQSLEIGLGPVKPLHEALDQAGHMWVTLANSDEVVRLRPTAATISSQAPEHFSLPGGAPPPVGDAPPTLPILGPGDVAVDKHGIVWVTLTLANAIARIDPTVAKPGAFDGIKIYHLRPCTDGTCRAPIGAVGAAAPLTRLPLQMKVRDDGQGDTDLFFTEQNADAIGALRVAPDGTLVDEQHFSCVCVQPLGIALDPDGDIWYSEGTSNRLGRMTLDPARPFAPGSPHIDHYNIPNPVQEPTPGAQPGTGGTGIQPLPAIATTALPHSVALDRAGRVWYSGEASRRLGYLDPAKAIPNTTSGFTDTAGPVNEFGRTLSPADITIDPAGTAWVADEYGDQIASATIAADGSVKAKFAFRPTARNSLTDSPLVDPQGNLWFNEAGANLVTRISNVAAKATVAPPPPGTAPSAPQPAAPEAPAPAVQPKAPAAARTCTITRWLSRRGAGARARLTLPLLGLTAGKVTACLGKPTRTTRTPKVETWVYPSVDLRFSRGVVASFTLRRAGLRSDPDRAAVGASLATFRTALGALGRDGRGYRAVVALGAKDVADVRLAVASSGKVARVTVTTVRRGALDRAGRTLLRRAR